MQVYSRGAALVFGILMTVLCVVIAAETIMRKFFSHSLAGVDELSGYAIVVGAPLAFTVALIEQSHIRINLLHMRLPRRVQAGLNGLAAVSLAALAVFLLIFTVRTVQETNLYGSTAQTPWATPLIWPQAMWLIGMVVFALAAVLLAIRAMMHVLRGETDKLIAGFGPDSVEVELAAELEDLGRRET
ncbi:MAG: TRAP transporter small permease [Gemmobacter sp.]|nr:TRAP transporter small permease [Gemmobacter sp.]